MECFMKSDWSKLISSLMPAGRAFRMLSSSLFTRSITSTVLVPDCFCTPMPTAGVPLNLAMERFSCIPSSVLPTSLSLMGAFL